MIPKKYKNTRDYSFTAFRVRITFSKWVPYNSDRGTRMKFPKARCNIIKNEGKQFYQSVIVPPSIEAGEDQQVAMPDS